jgi:DNA-binding MarR family transcriptional regulator
MTELETTTSPGVVARALGITPAVVTGMVNRLEDQGLVQRAIRGSDRRSWVLEVTEAGAERRDQLIDQQLATLAAALSSLSDEELRTVVDILALLERLVESGE